MYLPAGVPTTVTIAQAAGIVLSVYILTLTGDAVAGVAQLLEGYDDRIRKACPHATMAKWFCTAFIQTTAGLLLAVDSFMLMMQSETVIDLFLNLTGLHLLQEIDDYAFNFASTGILGKHIQDQCEFITEFKQIVPKNVKMRVKIASRVFAFLFLAGMLVPFTYLAMEQSQGKYLCTNVSFLLDFLPAVCGLAYSIAFHLPKS